MIWMLAAALSLASCADQSPPDDAEPSADAPRLAVLSPALAIILRDLGHADRIVARHGWDMATDAAIPVVGDQRGIDYEVLIGVDPDVVVMERGAEPTPTRLTELAESYGWEVVRTPMLSMADIRAAIGAMDALVTTGDEQPSAAAVELLDRLDRATAPGPDLARRTGRIVMLVSAGPPSVLGPGSFHYQIAESMGLDIAPRGGAPFINMGAEELRGLAPDTIVLVVPGADPSALGELLEPIAGLGIPAVERDRVVLITDAESLTPSTAMIRFAEQLASGLAELPEPAH